MKERAKRRPAHLYVEAGFLWNRPGARDARRGRRCGRRAEGASSRCARPPRTSATPSGRSNTPYLSAALEGTLAVYTGPARTLAEVQAIVARRQAEHAAGLARGASTRELFSAMQTILAWNLVYDPENDRAISPVSRLWNANWGGYVLFDWDTYFAAFMYSLYDEDLAYANAVEVTKGWTRHGFVPNFASAYGLKSEDRSQPPVGEPDGPRDLQAPPEDLVPRGGLRRAADLEPLVARGPRSAGALCAGARTARWSPSTGRVTPGRRRSTSRGSTTRRCTTACRSTRRRTASSMADVGLTAPLRRRLRRPRRDRDRPRPPGRRGRAARPRREVRGGPALSVGREGGHLPQPAHRHRRGEPEALAHELLPADREGADRGPGRSGWRRSTTSTRPSSTASG